MSKPKSTQFVPYTCPAVDAIMKNLDSEIALVLDDMYKAVQNENEREAGFCYTDASAAIKSAWDAIKEDVTLPSRDAFDDAIEEYDDKIETLQDTVEILESEIAALQARIAELETGVLS